MPFSIVRDGRVDYAAWKKIGVARLDRYLGRLASADLRPLSGSPEELAFWLNAYNACVIRAVLEKWPLKNVMDFQRRFRLAGRDLTLDEVENQVIRPRFTEPRIHFALVCAAVSCPPLAAEAWTGEGMEKRLEERTAAFLRSAHGVRFDPAAKVARVSRLFDWYKVDFEKAAGGVARYLSRYRPDVFPPAGPAPRIEYLDYDWALNAR